MGSQFWAHLLLTKTLSLIHTRRWLYVNTGKPFPGDSDSEWVSQSDIHRPTVRARLYQTNGLFNCFQVNYWFYYCKIEHYCNPGIWASKSRDSENGKRAGISGCNPYAELILNATSLSIRFVHGQILVPRSFTNSRPTKLTLMLISWCTNAMTSNK